MTSSTLQVPRMPAFLAMLRSSFGIVGISVILFLFLFAALFPTAASSAVRVWIIWPAFNHCFLVPLLTLFMIWKRRHSFVQNDISPSGWGAVLVLVFSFVWAVASFSVGLEAEQFVVITMIQAMFFAVFGRVLYRKLAGPLLYLYFLVPTGTFLIPLLQSVTARFTVVGLHLLGIPVFSTGAVIEIPAGTFAIAEACAGLRFLVAAVAFGVFFAIVTYRSIFRRVLFIGLSLVVPIVANGFRALGLIAAAQWIGSPAAALADHIIYGWIFFSVVLVLLVLIGHFFSDRPSVSNNREQFVAELSQRQIPWARMGLVTAACIVAALSGKLAAAAIPSPRLFALPQIAPRVSPPWMRSDENADWRPVLAHPSQTFTDTYVLAENKIQRYVALYVGNSRTSNLIRSANREADERVWTFNSSAVGELSVGGRSIPVRVSTWLRGAKKRKVWSFYVVNGKPVASALVAKWEQLKGDFGKRPCASAYVALSVEEMNRLPDAIGVAKLLSATEPLEPYLCRIH